MLTVNEIFYSIQGESSYSGLPCVIIRLTGCNLRCHYCDTQYAYNNGSAMSIDQIIEWVVPYSCPLVEITGGEPLIQEETPQLARQLFTKGYQVLVETNGTQDIDAIKGHTTRIIDIKTPSSGESKKTDWKNIDRLDRKDEIKFVLSDKQDYEWSKEIIHRYDLQNRCAILLSPVQNKLKPEELAECMMNDHLNVRLQLQLHKILWPNKTRGK